MRERSKRINSILIYTLGILVIGLAVSFLLRADLGVGAWDATSFNFNDMITLLINNIFNTDVYITYGTTSFIISIILLLFVILYRGFQKKHYLVFASIFFMSLSIDLWNLLILANFNPTEMVLKVILFVLAIFILPLGLAFLITSKLAASVYDEFTMVAGEILKIKRFSISKIVIEVLGVSLAFIFSVVTYLLQTEGMTYSILGHLNIGTVILTLTIGPLIGFYISVMEKKQIIK